MIAFDYQLGDSIRANLEAHERYIQPLEEGRHAAVAVVLVDSGAERHDADPIAARDKTGKKPRTPIAISTVIDPARTSTQIHGAMCGTLGTSAARIDSVRVKATLPAGRVAHLFVEIEADDGRPHHL